MQFIDLKAQYERIREPVNARIQAVLDRTQFVLGVENTELEQRLAEFVGVWHCLQALRVLSLPMHPYLTEDEQVSVVRALKEACCE